MAILDPVDICHCTSILRLLRQNSLTNIVIAYKSHRSSILPLP